MSQRTIFLVVVVVLVVALFAILHNPVGRALGRPGHGQTGGQQR